MQTLERETGDEGEAREGRDGKACVCMCALVGSRACPCCLFNAPPLFMFGNLRDGVKGEKKESWRMETERGSEFISPLSPPVCCKERNMRSL